MRFALVTAALWWATTTGAMAQQFLVEAEDQSEAGSGFGFAIVDVETQNVTFFAINELLPDGVRLASNPLFDAATGTIVFRGAAGRDTMLYRFDPIAGTVELLGPDLNELLANAGYRGISCFACADFPQAVFMGSSGLTASGIDSHINSASAAASALEIQLPVGDATNRLGLTTGTFGDEHAFGVSYARVQGRFDVGLAYAQGDQGRNAGKVSVGFSW